MKLYKKTLINVRVSPILLEKFHVAVGFNSLSASITNYMQNIVRDFEKQYGIIPVGTKDEDTIYDIITKIYGVRINKKNFEKLFKYYPKTSKNIVLFDQISL